MKSIKFIWFLAFLVLVSGCNFHEKPRYNPKVLLQPADFQLESIYGKQVSLSDYLGKKAVLMVFWTTWCPYCRAALISLKDERSEFNSMGLELLAVNIKEPLQKVRSFVEAIGVDFTVLLDRDFAVSDSLDILGVPTYIIINKSGKVVFKGNRLLKTKLQELDLE